MMVRSLLVALCLLSAMPAFAQTPEPVNTERTPYLKAMYVAFPLAQMLDYHSTQLALGTGKTREANGAMASCVHSLPCFIGIKAAVGFGVPLLADKFMRPEWGSRTTATYLAVLSGVVGGIATRNYRIYFTVRGR